MKLFKSILLIAACHAAQASATIDINADPNLTGAAPLTGILNGQKSDTQNMSGFDNTPPPAPPDEAKFTAARTAGGNEPYVWCSTFQRHQRG